MYRSYWINASAGTGKTTRLVARIRELLQVSKPQSILCITFTNYAAHEIQSRLMEHRIAVGTIHSFCFDLIQKYTPSDYTIMTQVQKQSLIEKAVYASMDSLKDIADNFALNHFLTLIESLFRKTSRFAPLFGSIDAQPKPFESLLTQEERDQLPIEGDYADFFLTQKKTARKNVIKKYGAFIEKECDNVYNFCQDGILHDWTHLNVLFFKAAQDIAARYQSFKDENQWLDHEDLLHKGLALLQNQDILYKVVSTFDHILLDEAQDTSPKQWEIINTISQYFFDDATSQKTIFIVGDSVQSIYGFQGTSPEVLEAQHALYKAQIGEKFVEERLTTNYRSGSDILAFVDKQCETQHHAHRDFKGSIELCDTSDVVAIVNNLLEQHEPKDIMFLFRKRDDYFHALKKEFLLSGIDVSSDETIILTQHLFIQDIMALIRHIVDPADIYTAACLLKSPFVGSFDDSLLQDISKLKPLYDAYKNAMPMSVIKDFCRYARFYDNQALQVLEAFLRELLDKNWSEAYDYFSNTKIELRLYAEKEYIRFMTIHGAKGLESPIVFLVESTTRSKYDEFWWFGDDVMLAPPSTLYHEKIETMRREKAIQDEKERARLLYVGLTRARDSLFIVKK